MKIFDMTKTPCADQVLKEFRKLARASENTLSLDMWAYTNGRERGYALTDSYGAVKRKVAFSENRNSDDIVVYFGKPLDFAFNTNVPSDEVYEARKFFRYDQHAKAAQFIFNYLTKG